MLVSGTLEIAGSYAVVVGVAAMDGLWWIALSVIQKSCCILLEPLLFPNLLMDLAQSVIADITLSACVMVGRVIFL